MRRLVLIALLPALATPPVLAQPHGQHSPYTELSGREIKALSTQQVDDLRQARGMGMSLPAELNGAPGPMHALELRQPLQLTDSQATALERVVAVMRQHARASGEEVIRAEAELEQAFKAGAPEAATIDRLAERIGLLNGQLRAVHLQAHRETRLLLSAEQTARYNQARGYVAGQAPTGAVGGHSGHQHRP